MNLYDSSILCAHPVSSYVAEPSSANNSSSLGNFSLELTEGNNKSHFNVVSSTIVGIL